MQEQNTPERRENTRGRRSNEARLRRIENIKYKRIGSRMFFRAFREVIPKEGWRLARPTHQERRALKAGGTDEGKTRGKQRLDK